MPQEDTIIVNVDMIIKIIIINVTLTFLFIYYILLTLFCKQCKNTLTELIHQLVNIYHTTIIILSDYKGSNLRDKIYGAYNIGSPHVFYIVGTIKDPDMTRTIQFNQCII